jgi:O-antigen/teichoic acid export membrane protein
MQHYSRWHFPQRVFLSKDDAGKVLAALISLVIIFVGLCYIYTLTLAEPIIIFLYGTKWISAAPYIEAFSVSMFFNALSGVVTPLLWSRGAVKNDARIQIVISGFVAIGAITAAQWSVVAVAWSVAFVFGLRTAILISVGIRLFPKILSSVTESILKGAVFLGLAGMTLFLTDQFLKGLEVSVLYRLIESITIFFVFFMCALRYRHLLGVAFLKLWG